MYFPSILVLIITISFPFGRVFFSEQRDLFAVAEIAIALIDKYFMFFIKRAETRGLFAVSARYELMLF